MNRIVTIMAMLAIWLTAGPVFAQDDTAFEFGPQPSWSLLFGPSGGGSFGTPGGGGYVGGELSLSRLNERRWWGFYADGVYDFGHRDAIFTAGPEFGAGFFGVDGGVALRTGSTDDIGGTARLLVTAGFFALYGRYFFFPEAEEHVGQIGVLFKIPLWASSGD
jgi:hypothetical protein